MPGPAPFRSLLVPIDLTPHSDRVLGRLPLLPLDDHARVTVLHVIPSGLTAREQRTAERDSARTMRLEVRHLKQSMPAGVSIQPLVKVGATAKAISACAAKVKAELIVMGRGGMRPLRDDLVGSTAERVIRRARVPVLVVRLPARTAYHRPVLAIELDEAASEAAAVLLRVIPSPRPAVTVVHAFDTPYRGLMYPNLSEDATEDRIKDLRSNAAQRVSALLRQAVTRAHLPPANAPAWKTQVRLGSPRIVIERAVRKADADLLVLGTRGHTGVQYLFLGTVAGDLLRHSTCDVLVVPPASRK